MTKPGTPSDRGHRLRVSSAAARDAGGPSYFTTRITEPNLRATTNFFDVRGVTMAVDDKPAAFTVAQTLRTKFDYDGMGQMLTATDRAGKVTTHEYDMAGQPHRHDHARRGQGHVGLRRGGQADHGADAEPACAGHDIAIAYDYDFGKLVSIDYPGTTPDVSYTYGDDGRSRDQRRRSGHPRGGRCAHRHDGVLRVGSDDQQARRDEVPRLVQRDRQVEVPDRRWSGRTTASAASRPSPTRTPKSLTYDYDEGGLAQTVNGSEEGLIRVQIGVDPVTGQPIFEDQPHTWTYEYLRDRQYDEMLRVRWQEVGNGAKTELTFDAKTLWLSRQQSFSPGQGGPAPDSEIQDLNYTYDSVGNPTEYRNNLPAPVSSLMGGSSAHVYKYDPLERIIGGTGIYDLSDNRHERYELSLTYDANGNVKTKDQYDAVVRQAVPDQPAGGRGGPSQDRPRQHEEHVRVHSYVRNMPGHNRTRRSPPRARPTPTT